MSNTKDMSMSNEMLEELTGLAQVQAVLGESTVDVGFKRVPLGKIVVDSEQPRKLLIEQSDDNVGQSQSASLIELRDSIVVHGILQPISVEKLKDQTGGVKYKIVFGERRFRAAVLARDFLASDPKARASSRKDYDFETIPAQIYTALDVVDYRRTEIQLIENIQRADMLPSEIGHAISKLIETGRYGDNEHAVAKALGMNVALVQRLCKLVSDEGRKVLEKWPGTEATVVYKICGIQPGGSSQDAKYWDLGIAEYLESQVGDKIYRRNLDAVIKECRQKEACVVLAERESAVTSTATGQVPVAAGEVSGDALPGADLYADTDAGSGHAAIFDAGGDAVGDGLVHSLTPPTAQDLAEHKNNDATGPRTVPNNTTNATSEEEIEANKILREFGFVEETRYGAFVASGDNGDVSADTVDVLCGQGIAVSMTLNTAQTFELAGWLTDWLKELKEQEKQHGIDKDTTVKDIPITVRLAVSPSDAVALTKLASGDAVNVLSMTPAVLREALMQIVKS